MKENNSSFQIDKYPSLNGLRAISILIVVLSHFSFKHQLLSRPASKMIPLLVDGQFGVNVFFVISGFIITRLLLKEEFINKTVSLKNFYIRRTIRIFPAYYFMLLVYFIMSRFGYIYIEKQSWLTSITYTKYLNWYLDWYTAHAWSLSIEENFYLLWPLFFIAGPKTRKFFIFFILLLIPLLRIFFYFHTKPWASDLSIFQRFDSIATGCFFALYQDKIIERISRNWKKVFYISIGLLLMLTFVSPLNMRYNLHLGFFILPLGDTFGTIANILIALIMMCSIFGPRKRWFNFLNSKVMNQIGVWSYSIYLWQELFTPKTDYFINQLPFSILFLFIAALTSYYLIERPFLKLKSNFSFQKKLQLPDDGIITHKT